MGKKRAIGPEFFKKYWETKKGHWELIYPDASDVDGWQCWLTVKCLDCGQEYMRQVGTWLVKGNKYGCNNCAKTKAANGYIKLLDGKGFDVDASATKNGLRVYKIKCRKCGSTFEKESSNLRSWIKRDARCRVCGGKDYSPSVLKIRKLHQESSFTYLELSQRAHYSHGFVRDIACGHKRSDETAKVLADIAEEMAKEKEHEHTRTGFQH